MFSPSRSNTLFSMWNTYEGRLPPFYYQEKLLNTGDFLFTVKVRETVVDMALLRSRCVINVNLDYDVTSDSSIHFNFASSQNNNGTAPCTLYITVFACKSDEMI